MGFGSREAYRKAQEKEDAVEADRKAKAEKVEADRKAKAEKEEADRIAALVDKRLAEKAGK